MVGFGLLPGRAAEVNVGGVGGFGCCGCVLADDLSVGVGGIYQGVDVVVLQIGAQAFDATEATGAECTFGFSGQRGPPGKRADDMKCGVVV